jgi:hypothetical protein
VCFPLFFVGSNGNISRASTKSGFKDAIVLFYKEDLDDLCMEGKGKACLFYGSGLGINC